MKQLGFPTLIDNLKWYIFLIIFNFHTVRDFKPESIKGLIISQNLGASSLLCYKQLGMGWGTSKHNCLIILFIMMTTTCFSYLL